jgi:hypothetical protein
VLKRIDVAVLPVEALAISADAYVVVDVLRATTTIATLFHRGLKDLVVVDDINAARKAAGAGSHPVRRGRWPAPRGVRLRQLTRGGPVRRRGGPGRRPVHHQRDRGVLPPRRPSDRLRRRPRERLRPRRRPSPPRAHRHRLRRDRRHAPVRARGLCGRRPHRAGDPAVRDRCRPGRCGDARSPLSCPPTRRDAGTAAPVPLGSAHGRERTRHEAQVAGLRERHRVRRRARHLWCRADSRSMQAGLGAAAGAGQ